MMDDFIGTYGNNLIVAVVGVGVALLVLAIALWLIRRRSGASPFIRGGRNRQPRLQVLDATAVDARRRLVLVRRDNVEHLVMIGGPTDIVIESGIGAIPILREVRDPQEADVKALTRQDSETVKVEPAIQQDRRAALPQQPLAQAQPASAPTEEPARQQRREPSLTPARPAPETAAPPRQATPPHQAQTPPPVREPAPAIRQAAPEKETARPVPAPAQVTAQAPAQAPVTAPPPVTAPAAAALPEQRRMEPSAPAVSSPSASTQPVRPQPQEQQSAPQSAMGAPAVFAAREPIDQTNAAEFLDAARERVLPGLKPEEKTPPAPFPPKPENTAVAPADAGPEISGDLASDFESFLEAEIARSKEADKDQSNAAPADKHPEARPALPPVTGATPDLDAQKEMARIFGELSVTRDR